MIDLESVDHVVSAARKAGVEGIAAALLHSYRNPDHEVLVRERILSIAPSLDVTLSHALWPRIGEYERAVFSVLNGHIRPKMDAYLANVESCLRDRLPGAKLFITRSNGGAIGAEEARMRPVHTLLSGPASGVTAVQFLGRSLPGHSLLAMDKGGTSTDLSLIRDGRPTLSTSAEGGGSIAWFDKGVLRVGPESAGARPGPACFRRGGTKATLTDAYLVCGYLHPERFLGGRMTLDVAAARRALAVVGETLGVDEVAAAEACISLATSNMIARLLPYLARYGVDPEELMLVA